jgi:hypothetical protein
MLTATRRWSRRPDLLHGFTQPQVHAHNTAALGQGGYTKFTGLGVRQQVIIRNSSVGSPAHGIANRVPPHSQAAREEAF